MTWFLAAVFAAEIVIMVWGFRRQSRKLREHEDNHGAHRPRPF